MKFSFIITILSLPVLYQLGFCRAVYFIVSILSFLYGYLFFDRISLPYFMKTYKCQIPKGLSKIVENMKEPDKTPLNTDITGSHNLDTALVDVINLVVRDYIEVWYKHISSSDNFTHEVRQSMYKILKNFSIRCRNVDWISVITEDLPNEIGSHIRLYRLSKRHCRRSKDKDLHEEFFHLESETDKDYCRQKICTDLHTEKDYLGAISEFILYIITSSEEFNIPPLRYLLRETLVNAVLLPTLNLVTNPDFINQYIVWMCKDNSYTSEYFIQAIRMSENPEELLAVLERMDFFTKRLRSRDSGGDDDALIKAQIGSLDFVRKICEARLQKLEDPKVKDQEDNPNSSKSISPIKISSISLEYILERETGVKLFLDFLTTANAQNLLTTYLCIEDFRSIYSKFSENAEDIFYVDERARSNSDSTYSSAAFEQQLNYSRKIFSDAKECNLTEKYLANIETKIVAEDLSEDMFDEIFKEIAEIIRSKHLELFKKSHYFQQFLDDIEYFRDDSLISEEDLISSTQTTAVDNTPSAGAVNVAPFVDTDTYTVRIVDAEINKNSFVVYTLVVIKTNKFGQKETWKAMRRYRDFDALNNQIISVCGKIPQLRLPAKKPFNNMTKEFLEKRSADLQEYLVTCFNPKLLQTYPALHQMIVEFVQQTSWSSASLNKMQSIVNPFKTMGNAVLSMPDSFVGNISRFYSTISPSKKGNPQDVYISNIFGNDQIDYSKFGNDNEQNKAESIPIRILFLLVDEIFDLQNKSQMVRRGIFVIIRRIVKTFFGLRVNKIIMEKAAKFTSADQMAEFVIKFKEHMWPNGKLSNATNTRDKMTILRTNVLCRTKMLGSISDEVSQFLGTDTTRQGIKGVYDLCQDQILNRRLAHSILQIVLQKIFPGHNLDKLIQYKLCPAANGKVCDKHNLIPPEWRDWGCL